MSEFRIKRSEASNIARKARDEKRRTEEVKKCLDIIYKNIKMFAEKENFYCSIIYFYNDVGYSNINTIIDILREDLYDIEILEKNDNVVRIEISWY